MDYLKLLLMILNLKKILSKGSYIYFVLKPNKI